MKIDWICFFLCGLFLVSGCASMSVNYDYDQQINFAGLKTYNWMPVPQKARAEELTIKHIKFAVDKQLSTKGLSISQENPDFLIAAHVTKEKRVDTEDWGYAYGNDQFFHTGPFVRPAFPGPRLGESQSDYQYRSGTDTYVYEIGTLIIDFVNAKTRELIWRGTAVGEIDPSSPSIDIINTAVFRILENYPPQKR